MTATHDSRASASGLLRRGPILLPAAAAAAVLVYLGLEDAGYGVYAIRWQSAALFLALLLLVALAVVPRAGGPSRLVAAAAALLAAYAVWSYLSIAWAGQPADAWNGANRAAFYAVVFALFAIWPLGRRGAALLLGAVVAAIGVIAVVALLKVAAASGRETGDLFVGGRLAWPVQYPNGGVALWFIAFWPAVALASRREVPPVLRGVFASCAVLFAGAGLLAQSRGWLFALPVMAVVAIAFAPGRVRAAWTLIGIGAAALVMSGPALDVLDGFGEQSDITGRIDSAVTVILITALVAGLIATALGYADRRVRVGDATARRTGRGMAIAAAVIVVAGGGAFVAREGDPVKWVDARWEEFKGGAQPDADEGARFTQTLGSNRYDFWRVAWNNFERRPVAGVGADNFVHDYLRERRSDEEPLHPHSLVLRTLSQTGLVGTLLLAAAIACAFAAGVRALERRRGVASAACAGGLTAFAYFVVHGSVDWFWELPALGGLAFAFLGIAAGLEPRPAIHPRTRAAREPLVRSPASIAAAALVGATLLVAFVPPLLSDLSAQRARDTFNDDPARAGEALDMLDRAAGLRPRAITPRLLQAQIVVALRQPQLAAPYYRDAIRRDARDVYSHLALASLESSAGRRAGATRLVERALELSPRDYSARELRDRLRAGKRITIYDVNADFGKRLEDRGR